MVASSGRTAAMAAQAAVVPSVGNR